MSKRAKRARTLIKRMIMLGETLSPQILKKYGIEEYSPQEGKETPPESPAKKAKVVAPEPVAVPELTPEPVVAPEPVAEEAKQKVAPTTKKTEK